MTTRVRLTYEDYAELPDHGRRYELHEGELSATPAPGTARYAVPCYWIVDPAVRTIEACQLAHGVYREAGTLSGTTTVSFPPFPDLMLDPREIWPAL